MFGERVAHRRLPTDEGGRRRCLHQVPAAVLEHARYDGLGGPDVGEQVDPCDLLDLLEAGVQAEHAGDAGVGAEDPYGAERGNCPFHQCVDRLRTGHVTRYRQTVDPLRHLFGPWTMTIGHDDAGALGSEAFGQSSADAVAAAGDDDALPLEVRWRSRRHSCVSLRSAVPRGSS